MKTINYTIMADADGDVSECNKVIDAFRMKSSFEEMCLTLKDIEESNGFLEMKEDAPFIVPCHFKTRAEGADLVYDQYVRRYAENVKHITMLPLDMDDGLTLDEARAKFKDYSYVLYTSFNHMKNGVHKFRMLFEMEAPVTPIEWGVRRDAMVNWLGGKGVVDATCLYVSRGFYTPSYNIDNAMYRVFEVNEGKKVDVLDFAVKQVPVYTGKPSTVSDIAKKKVLDALQNATVGSYERWWQMVQAMKSEGYDINDVYYASAGNPNHCSPSTGVKDTAQCESTFAQVRVQASGGIGKLVKIIQEGGDPGFHTGDKSFDPADQEKMKDELMNKLNSLRKGRKRR